MPKNVICSVKTNDCAASHNGFCAALSDTDFGGKKCPFYRSGKDQAAVNKKCLEQLRERGRVDLIEKYHINNI